MSMGYYGLKLSRLRRQPRAVVRQAQVFKQKGRFWENKQKETLGVMDDFLSKEGSKLGKRFEHVHGRYGHQLLAVKQLKLFYGGLKDNQLRKLVHRTEQVYSSRLRRRTSKEGRSLLAKRSLRAKSSLVRVLESRLQTAVWRRMLCRSIFRSRQAISHGKVKVNGKVVRQCSYDLKPGDLVELGKYRHIQDAEVGSKLPSRWVAEIKGDLGRKKLWEQLPFRCPPAHLEVRLQKGVFVFAYRPYTSEVMFPFRLDVAAVRNYYGRA